MKFFSKNIYLGDFIPPIFSKIFQYIKTLVNPLNNKVEEVKAICNTEIINSYSQYNEDLIVDALLSCKQSGIYVDVGANDPGCLNNTKRFYDRGWSGINIEPDLRLFEKLCKHRKRDINLNFGINLERGEMTFYLMSADTLSSFNKEVAIEQGKIYGASLIDTKKIMVKPLVDIFAEYLEDKCVDFMSVDVEGFELDVLKSNDWSRYRPSLLIIEIAFGGEQIVKYLEENDYILVFRNYPNGIFISNEFGNNISVLRRK